MEGGICVTGGFCNPLTEFSHHCPSYSQHGVVLGCLFNGITCLIVYNQPIRNQICQETPDNSGPGCTGVNITGCQDAFRYACFTVPKGEVYICDCLLANQYVVGTVAACYLTGP